MFVLSPQQASRALEQPGSVCTYSYLHNCTHIGAGGCPVQVPSLDYVYEDDGANLAVHYIASGPPTSWLRTWFSWRGAPSAGYTRQRAELVSWMRTHKRVDFEAVNGRLESMLHVAVSSGSVEVVEVGSSGGCPHLPPFMRRSITCSMGMHAIGPQSTPEEVYYNAPICRGPFPFCQVTSRQCS